jgi:hypothetical protein
LLGTLNLLSQPDDIGLAEIKYGRRIATNGDKLKGDGERTSAGVMLECAP